MDQLTLAQARKIGALSAAIALDTQCAPQRIEIIRRSWVANWLAIFNLP